MKNYFAGTLKQIKFILKRERVISAVWLAVLAALSAAVAAAYGRLFSSPEELASMSTFFKNPAMVAMLGPLYGELTIGSLYSGSMLLYTVLAAGLMNIFFIVRHTRADEETGRLEVVRSLPTGRLSNLGAALIAACALNLVLALLTGFLIAATGTESMGLSGAMLYGSAVGVSGLFFAALAALFSQVSRNSKGAAGFSVAVLVLLYIMRAAGDSGVEAVSLLSPPGMILRVQAFAGNYWWPVFAVAGISAVIAASAFYLNSRRDMGQGLLAERRGRENASALLKCHEGFIFRILRGAVLAWLAGMFILGAVYGSVMGDMESFIAGNDILSNVLTPPSGHTQTEMFITMIISMLAIVSAVPVAGAALKAAAEEKAHRAESILSKAVSRYRVLGGYLAFAFVEGFLMLFASALGLWSAAAAVMSESIAFSAMFNAFMVYLPALWVVAGIAALLVGLLPERASVCVYGYLGFSFFLIYLGRVLDFPDWTKYFSPFGYVPQLPMDTVNFLALGLLAAAAAVFAAAGFVTYRRRDLL